MTIKRVLGTVLFIGLLVSLGYKFNVGLSRLGDQALSIFLIVLVILFFVLMIRFILTR